MVASDYPTRYRGILQYENDTWNIPDDLYGQLLGPNWEQWEYCGALGYCGRRPWWPRLQGHSISRTLLPASETR